MPLVEVDDREILAGMEPWLEAEPRLRWRKVRMAAGDFRLPGVLLVERKRAVDFAASLLDGRLFRQAAVLAAAPEPAILVLEGTEEDWAQVAVSPEARQGALLTLARSFRLPCLPTADPGETLRLLVYAAAQADPERLPQVRPAGGKPRRTRYRRLRVLATVPGVGRARATALLEHFGSVAAVARATLRELREVPGVGPGTARHLQEVLGEASEEEPDPSGRGRRSRAPASRSSSREATDSLPGRAATGSI